MRSIATTRAALLAIFASALTVGALAWTEPATAVSYCTWDGVANGPPFTNMVALQNNVCTVTASGIAFQAGLYSPGAPGPPVSTGVPYTGFAFIAYDGGQIIVSGSGTSITSYPAVAGDYPGLTTAPYGVFSYNDSANPTPASSISFTGAATVNTTSANAFGLYATGGATISSSAQMTVNTQGNGASGVAVDTAGQVTLSGGATIVTTGDDAHGGQAESGGVIVLAGGSIQTSGAGSDGLSVTGGTSTITASSVSITTGAGPAPAAGGVGVYASDGGSATLNGGSVTTGGDSAPGLQATGAGSTITANPLGGAGVSVATNGAGSPGAQADTGGSLVLNGGSVTTSGVNAPGLQATGAGSTITANPLGGAGVAIATNGAGSPGAQADTGGALVLNGGSVTTSGGGAAGVAVISGGSASLSGLPIATSGQDSHALTVSGSGSKATLAGSNAFSTQGAGAIGVYASQGGAISASGATTVSTSGGTSPATGLGAYGVNADGAGSTVTLAATTVRTTGAGAFGLLASDAAGSGSAGSITVSGPLNVTTTNPAATAVGLQGAGASIAATGGGTIASAGGAIAFLGGTNQTATFNNFTIANQTGDLIFADPSTATVNFNSTTANAGTNALLNATGGSFVTVNAAASALTGAIATDSASTSNVNLTNGSTWTVTGSSAVSNLAVTNSAVVFAPPSLGGGFKTLTIGNYSGSGASIAMNAALAYASFPLVGQIADKIVINGGTASGQTLLSINNTTIGGAPTTGNGIPVVVATNGGTIDKNAFALAQTTAAGGYQYTLEQNGEDYYLVASPTTTAPEMAGSVNAVARAQQQALITGRVLSSILLGATEQVNCSNCSSGFGSIGSYALGAHGRMSITPELTLMGGFSYDEYTAPGITVTNAPTFAGAITYDPINFGRSRPFVEIGGGFVPFEQVRYTRTYPNGDLIAEGQGDAVNRSLGLFGRVGWVDRVTPIDEAAIYTDISRSWLVAGGYTEGSSGTNPFPATVSTGLEALDVARVGAQYTHLFGGQFEANVSGAVAYGFNSTNGSQWNIADFGAISPYPIGNSVWYEWGARVGYRVSQRMVVDGFILGTFGGVIGTTVHGGVGLRYLF